MWIHKGHCNRSITITMLSKCVTFLQHLHCSLWSQTNRWTPPLNVWRQELRNNKVVKYCCVALSDGSLFLSLYCKKDPKLWQHLLKMFYFEGSWIKCCFQQTLTGLNYIFLVVSVWSRKRQSSRKIKWVYKVAIFTVAEKKKTVISVWATHFARGVKSTSVTVSELPDKINDGGLQLLAA